MDKCSEEQWPDGPVTIGPVVPLGRCPKHRGMALAWASRQEKAELLEIQW